jgi:single-strand DNA-binding protein
MAGSVNKVILLGNLGRDPDVKSSQDGNKIVNLSIATSERWKDRNSGEQREKTEWHRVVIFNENIARIAEQYLRKGSNVYIEGQLQTRKWTDPQGLEKYTTEIVISRFKGELTLLGGRGDSQQIGGSDNAQPYAYQSSQESLQNSPTSSQSSGGSQLPPMNDLDDDIPF